MMGNVTKRDNSIIISENLPFLPLWKYDKSTNEVVNVIFNRGNIRELFRLLTKGVTMVWIG